MKLFYSHHCYKYDTLIEYWENDVICNTLGPCNLEIVHPQHELDRDLPESEIMENSFQLIKDCDVLVFSTVSGMIGHGVFNEVLFALNCGKPVYEIYGDQLFTVESIDDFYLRIDRFIFQGDNRQYAILIPPSPNDLLVPES